MKSLDGFNRVSLRLDGGNPFDRLHGFQKGRFRRKFARAERIKFFSGRSGDNDFEIFAATAHNTLNGAFCLLWM
jgi:hypothetical protein